MTICWNRPQLSSGGTPTLCHRNATRQDRRKACQPMRPPATRAGVFLDDMVLDDRTGDVYVTRLDTNELLRITPGGAVTPIATHADGLLGAANMSLIHVGQSTVIYLANGGVDFLGTGQTGGAGPAILKIT